jgi:hypothetical protein
MGTLVGNLERYLGSNIFDLVGCILAACIAMWEHIFFRSFAVPWIE